MTTLAISQLDYSCSKKAFHKLRAQTSYFWICKRRASKRFKYLMTHISMRFYFYFIFFNFLGIHLINTGKIEVALTPDFHVNLHAKSFVLN